MAVIDQFIMSVPVSAELDALAARLRPSVVAVRAPGRGGGAGVVWSDEGLIITNAHVVHGASAEVISDSGNQFPARVVALSRHLDLAALIPEGPAPAGGWRAVSVGDSTALRPGELVVAVGHPLGERGAITLGMVGGVGKLPWPNGGFEAIRAAITLRPGNSGGALADVAGRVVGIPNLVVGPGTAQAIPSHVVQRFLSAGRRW